MKRLYGACQQALPALFQGPLPILVTPLSTASPGKGSKLQLWCITILNVLAATSMLAESVCFTVAKGWPQGPRLD